MGLRKPPLAFTEYGLLMLSSVLNSKKAIQVNIHIIEVFVQLRKVAANYDEIMEKLRQLEQEQNEKFADIYKTLNYLLGPKNQKLNRIGFRRSDEVD